MFSSTGGEVGAEAYLLFVKDLELVNIGLAGDIVILIKETIFSPPAVPSPSCFTARYLSFYL